MASLSRKMPVRRAPGMPEHSEEDHMRSEQQGRNERAIALIEDSVNNSLDQAEELTRQAETQRLDFLAEVEKMKENAMLLKQTLEDAVRRRDAGEDFDVADVATILPVKALKTHTVSYHTSTPTPASAQVGLACPRSHGVADDEGPKSRHSLHCRKGDLPHILCAQGLAALKRNGAKEVLETQAPHHQG